MSQGRETVVGVVGVLRQRHHLGEGCHRQRVDGGFGAARDDDVGPAEPDLVDGEGDASLPEAQAETGVFTAARAPM